MADNPARDNRPAEKEESVVVGSANNFWIWRASSGWDLTHPPTPESSTNTGVRLACEVSDVTIDPAQTALVIVDFQNINMHPALEPGAPPEMHAAEQTLVSVGLPAARRLGMLVIWLNWGLTEDEVADFAPSQARAFAFRPNAPQRDLGVAERDRAAAAGGSTPADPAYFLRCGERPDLGRLPGADLGEIELADGARVDAGRALVRGTWNAGLHGPSAAAYEADRDVWADKNRKSGLWRDDSPCAEALRRHGVRTLLFAGANTDQCLGSTLQAAHAQGYDTLLLKDASATDSPAYAQAAYEFNSLRSWGFLTSCQALAEAAASQAE